MKPLNLASRLIVALLPLVAAGFVGCSGAADEPPRGQFGGTSGQSGGGGSGGSTAGKGGSGGSGGSAGSGQGGAGAGQAGSSGQAGSAGSAGGSACATTCARSVECSGVAIDDCLAKCEATDSATHACLDACTPKPCDSWGQCVTACLVPKHDGDPYGSDNALCGADESAGVTCPSTVLECSVLHPSSSDKIYSVCMPYCTDGPCPPPKSGTATPVCGKQAHPVKCTLDCSPGKTCPDGMECLEMECDKYQCFWRVK